MFSSLLILRPLGLTVATLVAVLCAATGRYRRLGRSDDAASISGRRRVLVYAPLMAVAALLLPLLNPQPAHLLLGLLALAAGAWFAWERYQLEDITSKRRRALVALRCVAWLALLVLLARPAWETILVEWDKPVLPVLVDHSRSMGLTDPGASLSRAEHLNRQLGGLERTLAELERRYDVKLRAFGLASERLEDWHVEPRAALTAIHTALQDALELRSNRGRPPPHAILISDGADNVTPAADALAAAQALAEQRTALHTVAAGPPRGSVPLVKLDPLGVPPRIGLHEELHVTVRGRAQSCDGHRLPVELLWDEVPADRATVDVEHAVQRFATPLTTLPPGPGAHRLTARVTLPRALGGGVFETSAIVDVDADLIRILVVERVPHMDLTFALRAWRPDERLAVTRRMVSPAELEAYRELPGEFWSGFDVIVLGRTGSHMPLPLLGALAEAVEQRGAGLLLVGGRTLLNGRNFVNSALEAVAPVRLTDDPFGREGPLTFSLTDSGRAHPIFQPLAAHETAAEFGDLPALGGSAWLGEPRPLATTLAVTGDDAPLLVAHDVGKGRCIVAGWESIWHWSLASDAGQVLHQRLWRQMVLWLANRRPQAWVLTDRANYGQDALEKGRQRVRIRAGISGLADLRARSPGAEVTPRLVLFTSAEQDVFRSVRLEQTGEEWQAVLPAPGEPAGLAVGDYTLRFEARVRGAGDLDELAARTTFSLIAQDLELQPPTADAALLESLAAQTQEVGGTTRPAHELDALLEALAGEDHRQKLLATGRAVLVTQHPLPLFVLLLALLGAEWAVRKRSGLS